MILKLFEQHKDCTMCIRWRTFQNKSTPTGGLFCKDHNVFLDWLPDSLAYQLIDEGVEQELWKPSARQLRKQRARSENEANRQQRQLKRAKA